MRRRADARVRTSGAPPSAGHGFSRADRLRKRADYLRVQGRPRARARARLLTVLVAPSDREARRLGIVASRKVGNAVARNRAKRLLREAFRAHKHELAKGIDIVVIVHPGLAEESLDGVTAELLRAIADAFRKASRVAGPGAKTQAHAATSTTPGRGPRR